MIARSWHGKTIASKGDAYKKFLLEVAVQDYKSIDGLLGLDFLFKVEDGQAHFTLITFWPSIDTIKKFAGEDFEKAKYYEEDKDFLIEFEDKVTHYEVFYRA